MTLPEIKVTGTCGKCGGKMIPHPRKLLVWICENSHWWNRKRHAYLVGSLKVVEKSK